MSRGVLVSFALVCCAQDVAAQNWPRFRGPNGAGVSSTVFPTRWSERDYLWKIKLPGLGHSSPVLWGDKVFITSGDNDTGKRLVLCLNPADGTTLWSRSFDGPKSRKHADNSFASSTPAVDERHVYVTWGDPQNYLVLALDHEGKEIWRSDLGPYKAGHGFGASPIAHKDLLIVPNDQDGQSALIALDRDSGKERWKLLRRCRAGYATPCLLESGSGAAAVIITSYEQGVTSVDPASGKIQWELDVFDKSHPQSAIASPIVAGDLVLATSGWLSVKYETVAVRLPRNGAAAHVVFKVDKIPPLTPTPLVKDDMLFLWNDRGVVACLDLATGKEHWRERVAGSYYGSPICAGRHLYCISREGDMVVLAAAKTFQHLATIPLGEASHSTPAIAQGRMFLRTFTHLMCLKGS